MPTRDLLWVEKYRPRELKQMVLADEHRTALEGFLGDGAIPHLLLVGNVGSGKTTVARILVEAPDCTCLELNASDERGIDVIRNRVRPFLMTAGFAKWRVAFLDEFDSMCLSLDTEIVVVGADHSTRVQKIADMYGQVRVLSVCFDQRDEHDRYRIEEDNAVVVDSGEADLYELELDDGRVVRCSAEHPFFVLGEDGDAVKVKLRDLQEGSEILVADV